MKKEIKVLVIGAGISGLTTAICLREKGFNVVMVAERFSPGLVSNVAGALWEWPPAACGKHGTPRSLERSKNWCMTSYETFKALQAEYGSESTGIYLRNTTFYFHDVLEKLPEDLKKMNELAGKVDNFRRGLDVVPNTIDLASQQGIKDAYRHMAPMIDTDVYLQWLLNKIRNLDCEIIQEKIECNLIEHEQALLDRFQCAAIVNCTGLGAIETANDPSMYPLRGALIRVKDEQGLIDGAHCISHKETSNSEQDIVFIVPRGNKKTVILGGLVQMHQWEPFMRFNDPIIQRMYNGCLEFLPPLKSLPLHDEEPVRTGLRPFTQTNVCVEHVPATHLFYNYGHGGAGITLSWGCAQETAANLQSVLQQKNSPTSSLGNQKQTYFWLQDTAPVDTNLAFIRTARCNLVLLCSRKGLSQIVPSQFEHFHYVQILENYDLLHLLEAISKIKNTFALNNKYTRIISGDKNTLSLATEIREALGLVGDKPRNTLPFTYQHATNEHIQGAHYHINVIILKGEIAYFAPCRCSHTPDETNFDNTRCYQVIQKSEAEYPILLEFTKESLSKLPAGYPPSRVVSFDVALDNETNVPTLLAINAHAPNTLISKLFETHQGLSLYEWHIRLQMGDLQKPRIYAQENNKYSALCIYPKKAGIVKEINMPAFNSTTEIIWRIHPGQKIAPSETIEDYALAILLTNNNWEDLKHDLETAHTQHCYKITL